MREKNEINIQIGEQVRIASAQARLTQVALLYHPGIRGVEHKYTIADGFAK